MNKKTLYWIVGLVIVVLVIIVWMFAGKSSNAPVENKVAAVVAKQTVHDLINSGATQTCTFSISATATSSSLTGTVYMDSGKFRGDFVKTDPSNTITNAHMIIIDGMDYLWSDTQPKGAKVSQELAFDSKTLSNKVGIDINQPTIYSCTSQTPDQSRFTLPPNMTFTDVTRLLQR